MVLCRAFFQRFINHFFYGDNEGLKREDVIATIYQNVRYDQLIKDELLFRVIVVPHYNYLMESLLMKRLKIHQDPLQKLLKKNCMVCILNYAHARDVNNISSFALAIATTAYETRVERFKKFIATIEQMSKVTKFTVIYDVNDPKSIEEFLNKYDY